MFISFFFSFLDELFIAGKQTRFETIWSEFPETSGRLRRDTLWCWAEKTDSILRCAPRRRTCSFLLLAPFFFPLFLFLRVLLFYINSVWVLAQMVSGRVTRTSQIGNKNNKNAFTLKTNKQRYKRKGYMWFFTSIRQNTQQRILNTNNDKKTKSWCLRKSEDVKKRFIVSIVFFQMWFNYWACVVVHRLIATRQSVI